MFATKLLRDGRFHSLDMPTTERVKIMCGGDVEALALCAVLALHGDDHLAAPREAGSRDRYSL
jgi:hypothetical protein